MYYVLWLVIRILMCYLTYETAKSKHFNRDICVVGVVLTIVLGIWPLIVFILLDDRDNVR